MSEVMKAAREAVDQLLNQLRTPFRLKLGEAEVKVKAELDKKQLVTSPCATTVTEGLELEPIISEEGP
jgi:hypothetical protein